MSAGIQKWCVSALSAVRSSAPSPLTWTWALRTVSSIVASSRAWASAVRESCPSTSTSNGTGSSPRPSSGSCSKTAGRTSSSSAGWCRTSDPRTSSVSRATGSASSRPTSASSWWARSRAVAPTSTRCRPSPTRRDSPPGRLSSLGHVTHDDLLACYATAGVFVSMSEHEGFGVPLVESMLMRVPILAYSATAVPHTLGGAGVSVLPEELPRGGGAGPRPGHRAAASFGGARGPGPQAGRLLSPGGRGSAPLLRGLLVSNDPPEIAFVVQRYGFRRHGRLRGPGPCRGRATRSLTPDHGVSPPALGTT